MAKSEYQFEGSALEKWLIEYYDKNIEEKPEKINSFLNELYKKVNSELDMISLPENGQGVLYAGDYSNQGMWQIFC